MAETELSAMTGQCLDQRIDTLEKLSMELDTPQARARSQIKGPLPILGYTRRTSARRLARDRTLNFYPILQKSGILA
jgi:hypothetical protein